MKTILKKSWRFFLCLTGTALLGYLILIPIRIMFFTDSEKVKSVSDMAALILVLVVCCFVIYKRSFHIVYISSFKTDDFSLYKQAAITLLVGVFYIILFYILIWLGEYSIRSFFYMLFFPAAYIIDTEYLPAFLRFLPFYTYHPMAVILAEIPMLLSLFSGIRGGESKRVKEREAEKAEADKKSAGITAGLYSDPKYITWFDKSSTPDYEDNIRSRYKKLFKKARIRMIAKFMVTIVIYVAAFIPVIISVTNKNYDPKRLGIALMIILILFIFVSPIFIFRLYRYFPYRDMRGVVVMIRTPYKLFFDSETDYFPTADVIIKDKKRREHKIHFSKYNVLGANVYHVGDRVIRFRDFYYPFCIDAKAGESKICVACGNLSDSDCMICRSCSNHLINNIGE